MNVRFHPFLLLCGMFVVGLFSIDALAERNWFGTSDYVVTSSNGSYTSLAANPTSSNYWGDEVSIYNTNAVALRVQRANNTNAYILLQTNMGQLFKIEAQVGELQVLRNDGATNQITVPFEVIRYFKRTQ